MFGHRKAQLVTHNLPEKANTFILNIHPLPPSFPLACIAKHGLMYGTFFWSAGVSSPGFVPSHDLPSLFASKLMGKAGKFLT